MGLTIHYKLAVQESISASAARELVERAALYAKEIGCAEVVEIMRVEPDFPFTSLFVRTGGEEDGCFGDVPAQDGWLVSACPGDGCESVFLALCLKVQGHSAATCRTKTPDVQGGGGGGN